MKQKIGKEIRMIALDLDGTTLTGRSEISPRTVEALHRAMEQGVHIVISTGRPWCSLPEAIFGIDGLEYMITSNGAAITRISGRERIYENCNEPAAVERIVALLRGRGFSVDAFTDGQAYIGAAEYREMKENGCSFRDADYVLRTRRPVADIFDFMLEHKDRLENISIVFRREEDQKEVMRQLAAMDDITLTSSFHNNLEIGGPTTSKADALRFLMRRLSIDSDRLLACGDSPNDSRMIELARIGIVMGNASEHMKARADFVTDTNDNDGVAKAIEKFVL